MATLTCGDCGQALASCSAGAAGGCFDGCAPPAEVAHRREDSREETTVDLVIRLRVAGTPAEVARYRAALECLAAVMAVQAEDGLWSLGHAEAESDEGPSEHVADIESACVHTVLIEGCDELTKGRAPWNGMCPAGKHGLDFEGQRCDLCPSTEIRP